MNSMNWLMSIIIIQASISSITSKFIPENHYKGCFGTDILVHKVPQYQPSQECWHHCEIQGKTAVSVVGGRWCGCSKSVGLHPGGFHCEVRCNFIPKHRCQCYGGELSDYDEVSLTRAFEYMEKLPEPNKLLGYNCHDIPIGFYYERYPLPVLQRESECLTLCGDIPRKYGSLLTIYKCGCKRTDDPNDDVLLPITKECVHQMVCLEIKTSVCLCGDTEVDPRTYASVKSEGPLLNSDKFRCYFTTSTDASAMKKRRPDFQPLSSAKVRPEDCIRTCQKSTSKFAALQRGGLCTCHDEIKTNKFTDDDCAGPCSIDTMIQGCGGKYSASIYSTEAHAGQISAKELDDLFREGDIIQPKTEPIRSALEGCYAIDELVHKVPIYIPNDECWKKCESPNKQVVVAGGRWCGCPSNGIMGAGDGNCFIYCAFIPQPKCECFTGTPDTYDETAINLVKTFIKDLPLPHSFHGYHCHSEPLDSYKHIYPSAANKRAYECFTETCKGFNRNLGAYLMGYRCGCKRTDNTDDDSLLPVTKDCVDRMICIEDTVSSCLCGDDKVEPLSYSPSTRVGPLLNSDKYRCIQMQQSASTARKLRHMGLKDIWKHDLTPAECIQTCADAEYAFAGVFQGKMCSCQNFPGTRKVTKFDCNIGCPGNDIPHGCGGPYTASVYATKNSIALTVNEMVNVLKNDIQGVLQQELTIAPPEIPTTESILEIEKELAKIKLKGHIEGQTQEQVDHEENDEASRGAAYAVVFSILSAITVLGIIAIWIIWKRRQFSRGQGLSTAEEEISRQQSMEGGNGQISAERATLDGDDQTGY